MTKWPLSFRFFLEKLILLGFLTPQEIQLEEEVEEVEKTLTAHEETTKKITLRTPTPTPTPTPRIPAPQPKTKPLTTKETPLEPPLKSPLFSQLRYRIKSACETVRS